MRSQPLRWLAAAALLAAPAAAQTPPPRRFEAGAEAVSRYVFAGLTFSDQPVVHPSLALRLGGFRLTAFGTWYSERDALQEADLFLEYGAERGAVSIYAAASRYHFEQEQGWRGHLRAVRRRHLERPAASEPGRHRGLPARRRRAGRGLAGALAGARPALARAEPDPGPQPPLLLRAERLQPPGAGARE